MTRAAIKPDLTMFSDASVFPNEKISGWGFWLKGDGRESMFAGGPLRAFDANTTVAELEAMANGLACAKASGYFADGDQVIMLQTDSTDALGCLRFLRPDLAESKHENSHPIPPRRKRPAPRQLAAAQHVLAILDEFELVAILRHVKGHKTGGGRNWVNRLCDRLAKDGANTLRAKAGAA
jgi:ribonuclease HI